MGLLKKIAGLTVRSLIGFVAISLLIIVLAFLPTAVTVKKVQTGEQAVVANAEMPAMIDLEQRNGLWRIHPDSAVYVALRTPRDKVNIKFTGITGSLEASDMTAGKMLGNVQVDVTSLDSGLKVRDNKMREADFLDAVNHPSAAFQLKNIGRWSKRWGEGGSQKFSASGTITIKGISKDVNFECEGMFVGDRFLMKGTHTLNMDDFRIKSPDGILIRTEKEATINLQLILIQTGKEGSAS